jgi:predicted deacylase
MINFIEFMSLNAYFSATYSQAREKFLLAAQGARWQLTFHEHPNVKGADGEILAMDVASHIPADARSVVLVTSAMHGAEGFCGSGCQIALMHDDLLLERFTAAKVGLILLHAVNPFGFSHLRRVNEDNIDLNRNFVDFSEPLAANPGYDEVHDFVVPEQWPATAEVTQRLENFIAKNGLSRFQEAVTVGQNKYADGLFYSGVAPAWSNTVLREILRTRIARYESVAWIDIHTGLGPSGHGEKICAGRNHPDELIRARHCWGADVVSPYNGESASAAIRGPAGTAIPSECPNTVSSVMALEFGTVPVLDVLNALRGDQWLVNAAAKGVAVEPTKAREIKQTLKNAFYTDTDAWRGAVSSQTRVAVLQALISLERGWQ